MLKKTLLFVVALLAFAPQAYAYKRAPFPDAKSLQPIPVIAHPDVSGSVERSSDGTLPANNESASPVVQAAPTEAVSDNVPDATSTPKTGSEFPIVLIVGMLSMAVLIFLFIVWAIRAV